MSNAALDIHRRLWSAKDARAVSRADGVREIRGVKRVDFLGRITFDKAEAEAAESGVFLATKTDEGFLRVEGRISRTGVLQYEDSEGNTWGELRTADEVFHPDSMASFQLSVVTEGHPDDMVSVDNVKDVQVGQVGTDVRQDGRFLVASFLITDAAAIASVEDGTMRQLSGGYTADVIIESGTHDGVDFAARQTKIRGNHVAKVDRGRCGPNCALLSRGDAFESAANQDPRRDQQMPVVTIEGKEFEISTEMMERIMAAQSGDDKDEKDLGHEGEEEEEDDKDEKDEDEKDQGEEEEKEKDSGSSKDDFSALKARVDTSDEELKSIRTGFDKRVDDRADLAKNASRILGAKYSMKTDRGKAKSDSLVMRDIILKVQPGQKDRLGKNKADTSYVRSMYESALELEAKRIDSSEDLLAASANSQVGTPNQGSAVVLKDSIGGFIRKQRGVPAKKAASGE